MHRTKIIYIALGAAIVLGFAGWQYGVPAYRLLQERELRSRLASDPRTRDEFQFLEKAEAYEIAHPDDVQGPISLGLVWKTFGEARGGDRQMFERSRDAFERGVALFGERNTVILMNAGTMQRLLGNYQRAEELYQQAIRVNPGQSEQYLALVDLYRYTMQKERGDQRIIDTYREALSKVLTNADIVQSLAFYLRDMHRYKDALPYLQVLSKNFPEDGHLELEIKAAEEAIARGEDQSTGTAPPGARANQ